MTTAHYAAEQGDNSLLDVIAAQDTDFKNKKDSNGNTPLFYAIKSKNIETVKKNSRHFLWKFFQAPQQTKT